MALTPREREVDRVVDQLVEQETPIEGVDGPIRARGQVALPLLALLFSALVKLGPLRQVGIAVYCRELLGHCRVQGLRGSLGRWSQRGARLTFLISAQIHRPAGGLDSGPWPIDVRQAESRPLNRNHRKDSQG